MKSKMLTEARAALEVNIHDDAADVSEKKDCDDGKNDGSAGNGSRAQERV